MKRPSVFAEERQRAILALLRDTGKVTVEKLAEMYRVSAATIRADLARLEAAGQLLRTHGGAIRADGTLFEPSYDERRVMRGAEKQAIARAAAELVQPGETILLDAGTTTMQLAMLLRQKPSLTIVTNSLTNALCLMESSTIEVVVIGGHLQRRRLAAMGPLAVRFLDGFRVDRAFLGFNGVDADGGLTVVDFGAAEVKRRMMAIAGQVIVVADSEKLGRAAFAQAAPITAADLIITDEDAPPRIIEAIKDRGVSIQLV